MHKFYSTFRVGAYVIGGLLVSVVSDFSASTTSSSYFANKDNAINVWMVKWGFGWTLFLLIPFVALTSHTYGCGRPQALRSSMARLAISTVIWMTTVTVFERIKEMTGVCTSTTADG